MRARILSLVLCLLAVLPQQVCACHLFDSLVAAPVHHSNSSLDGDTCDAPAQQEFHCSCHCHESDVAGMCSHISTFAVNDSSKSIAADDFDEGPAVHIAHEASATTDSRLVGLTSPFHRLGRAPIYLVLCNFRN